MPNVFSNIAKIGISIIQNRTFFGGGCYMNKIFYYIMCMKKFFVFVLTATMVVACQSRKEPVATMELQEEGISGDTLVSVYEGWAESQDGSSVLYDLMILTPENGGDVSYEMMMTYYDPVTKQDTSILTPAMLVVEEGTMSQQPDSVIRFSGKNGEKVSLWVRGDSMLVMKGHEIKKDLKKIKDKAEHVLKRMK